MIVIERHSSLNLEIGHCRVCDEQSSRDHYTTQDVVIVMMMGMTTDDDDRKAGFSGLKCSPVQQDKMKMHLQT